jgi:Holliday junction resolvasome RuvABC endonuclease subunit
MRLIRLRGKLDEIKNTVGVDVVAYEAARHAAPGMQGALVCQAEIQGVIKIWCEENGVQYRGYSPSEIKRHATGKGNANKTDMKHAAISKFGIESVGQADDNEIDARWILSLFVSENS